MREDSPPPPEPIERKPNKRGYKVEFRPDTALTHEFDDSNLWGHGECVYVCEWGGGKW